MKKAITTIIISLLASTSIFAKESSKYSFDDLYQEFSKAEGVEAVNIGGLLIGLACLFIDDIDYELIKNLEKLTILDTSKSNELIKTEFRNSIDKIDNMDLLMEVSDETDNLKILIERNKDQISRLLIIETEEPCIICIKCDMNTEDLNKFVAEINK